jgi:hypothetical protein
MRGAVLVRVVAAALAAIAIGAGLAQLIRLFDVEHSTTGVRNDLALAVPIDGVPPVRFLLTLTSVNPAERTVTGTLSLVPSVDDSDRPVFYDRGGRPVIDPATGRVRPEFEDANLVILLRNGSTVVTDVNFPLSGFELSAFTVPLNSREVSVTIPADVDPTDFPNDAYTLDLSVTAYLDSRLIVAGADEEPPVISDDLGVSSRTGNLLSTMFGVAADDRLGSWNLDSDRTVTTSVVLTELGRLRAIDSSEVSVSRPWSYSAFVYAISLMPAVIGLGFFVRTRHRTTDGSGDTAAALELAAALLALITLRQVFVPADISGLTRLDLLLGGQLLVVCWLMAVTYVRTPATAEVPTEPASSAAQAAASSTRPVRRPSRLRGHPPRRPEGRVRR